MFIFSLNASGFGVAPMPRSNVPFCRSEMFFQGHGSVSLFPLLQAAAEYPASCKRRELGGKEQVISKISNNLSQCSIVQLYCPFFFFLLPLFQGKQKEESKVMTTGRSIYSFRLCSGKVQVHTER